MIHHSGLKKLNQNCRTRRLMTGYFGCRLKILLTPSMKSAPIRFKKTTSMLQVVITQLYIIVNASCCAPTNGSPWRGYIKLQPTSANT